jgi:hypothetical protein
MNFGYFYHITQKCWPKEICLIPREYGEYRSYDEPTIARTCVSQTIAGCLCSIGWLLKFEKPVFIYRTKFKVLTENPYNVDDSCITGEKWLLKSTSFVLVGKLNWGFYPLKINDCGIRDSFVSFSLKGISFVFFTMLIKGFGVVFFCIGFFPIKHRE